VKVGYKKTYFESLEHGLPVMDLKAASYQNARADRLTWFGMAVCFLMTGTVLLATLAIAHPVERQADVPPAGSFLSK
jgi:hypothetical protein